MVAGISYVTHFVHTAHLNRILPLRTNDNAVKVYAWCSFPAAANIIRLCNALEVVFTGVIHFLSFLSPQIGI